MPVVGRKALVVVLVVVLVLLALLAWDLSRPPLEQCSSRLLLGGIYSYQRFLSPALGRAGVRCRFEPSCSRYAAESIRNLGRISIEGMLNVDSTVVDILSGKSACRTEGELS